MILLIASYFILGTIGSLFYAYINRDSYRSYSLSNNVMYRLLWPIYIWDMVCTHFEKRIVLLRRKFKVGDHIVIMSYRQQALKGIVSKIEVSGCYLVKHDNGDVYSYTQEDMLLDLDEINKELINDTID